MLDEAERLRKAVSVPADRATRSALGQFMTPVSVASFMAGLFQPDPTVSHVRLLDAGAGLGALSCAFLDRVVRDELRATRTEVVAYEVDSWLADHLNRLLQGYGALGNIDHTVCVGDFVEAGADLVVQHRRPFTHAILNPPYKKIGTGSRHRLDLRRAGIETVNLYSGFVALSARLLTDGGQLVAIIPRSFCSGPYYRPFRGLILDETAIRQIHLFDARDKTFRDDGVLQETIILHLQKGVPQGDVLISTSTDDGFSDLEARPVSFSEVLAPNDPELVIHIPTTASGAYEGAPSESCLLSDLGLRVSTGPVVDFRVRQSLRQVSDENSVPLLYPGHFRGLTLDWPRVESRKPNALVRNEASEKWLLPMGWYPVVRRFSAKEERRRVVAGIVDPNVLGDSDMIGIENHLNVIHEGKRGLSEEVAKGLATFLNTTLVDDFFRTFGGHTQVNATDLRRLRYPAVDVLHRLGRWAMATSSYSQDAIDRAFAELR